MTGSQSISEHWGTGDVYARIINAMEAASISPDAVTVEQLAPLDHFHARGFPATVDLADALPIQRGHHIVDIGCGIGGPARYLAKRFGCRVSGVDITQPFVEAANKLTTLLKMERQVAPQHVHVFTQPRPKAILDGHVDFGPLRELRGRIPRLT